MAKIHFVIYICNKELLLLDVEKNKIINKTCKSLEEDQIINGSLFIDEFNQILKENHIKLPLFGWKGCFIVNKQINNTIKEKYQEILSDYFSTIEFKNINEIINTENDRGYINITEKYVDYYFTKKNKFHALRIDLEVFNGSISKIIRHLITQIYKAKKLVVFGNYADIPKIADEIIKNYNIETKFPELPSRFLLEEYRK